MDPVDLFLGVMFSISRSSYSLLVQFLFLATNGLGVLFSTIYNASTPDLYPNNAHHKIGWILTWVMTAQIIMGVISAYTGRKEKDHHYERAAFIPISAEAMAEHQRMHSPRFAEGYRFSNDSGQGTERNTESLRSQSISSQGSAQQPQDARPSDEEDQHAEKTGLMSGSKIDRFLSRKVPGMLSSRVLRVFQFFYNLIDRVILLLGFIGIATGFITYGGFFVSPHLTSNLSCNSTDILQIGDRVFSGLAHFIKGGVFFWLGILNLGRWAGCFADIGWVSDLKLSCGDHH